MRLETIGELNGQCLARLQSADRLGYLSDGHIRVAGPFSEQMNLLSLWSTSLPVLMEFAGKPENVVVAILLETHSRFTWKNRCKTVYEDGTSTTPANVIIMGAEKVITTLSRKFTSETRRSKIDSGKKALAQTRVLHERDKLQRNRHAILTTVDSLGRLIPEDPETREYWEDRDVDRTDALEVHHPRERWHNDTEYYIKHLDATEKVTRTDPRHNGMLEELELLGFTEIREEMGE
ncbi:hypothetical protein R1sor_010965 [Riccia sorocarpa]|uniref:Uncharacterized protein n=1 Tax=Riccia sorocarpa TaxID=122646 RepID=A0ABD3I5L6_9MARC